MNADRLADLADALEAFVAAVGIVPLVVTGVLLVTCVVVPLVALVRGRRRMRREVRSIVRTVEELRSARGRGAAKAADVSSLGLVADALQRLGTDLQRSWAEAESSAERWQAVTEATHDTAIITTDADGDIHSFSTGAAALTGWTEEEILSRPAAVLFDEQAYKDLLPKLTRRSLREQGVATRSKLVRRDGTSFPAEVAVRLLQAGSSRPVGFMMVVRDVTEQLRLEEGLRAAERRYRALVEGLDEGVVILREGRIVFVNPAAEELCGRGRGELGDRPWREVVSTRDLLVVESAIGAAASGAGPGEELHCTLLGADGAPRAEVRIRPGLVEYDGEPAVLLLVQDETLARRAEAELRRNETRLDAVLEATSDGVLVLGNDPRHLVLMTNRAFADMLGVRVEHLLGASEDRLARVLHEAPREAGRLAERIAAGAGGGDPEVLTLGGEPPREIRVTQSPLRDRHGESLGRVVACRDVTERRRSEREMQEQAERLQLAKVELERAYEQLREVNRTLETRGEELDRLNQELQRLDRMKSDLIGNVSHELQTPLVSIRGYTEMILKERLGPVSEEQRKGLSLSLKNIDRLIAMIDSLLAFSRAHPEPGELKLSRFELRPLLDEVVALLDEEIGRREQRVELRLEPDPIGIEADRDKVHQVFLNLLSNAVKYGRRGGTVEVRGRAAGAGYAKLSIRDDGVGIPREAIGRVFDRHYQVPREATGEEGGSGIGLAIVRDILHLHGCTIEVSSEEGRGTQFDFTLPLAREDVPAARRAGERDAPTPEIEPDTVAGAANDDAGERESVDDAENGPPEDRPRLRIIRRYKNDG